MICCFAAAPPCHDTRSIGPERIKKCRRHHFSTIYHHFRPFSRPPRFEIRSMNQGSDHFPALSGPLKNGENGENGAARQAPFFFRYFERSHRTPHLRSLSTSLYPR